MIIAMTEHPWLKAYPEGIDWHRMIPARPLYALLDEAAARFPEHTAIDFLGKTYSYRELHEMSATLACGLRRIGVSKGRRVGLMLPNCPQCVISYFAILKAGGVVVNFNPLYSERELKHQIEDSGCEIMISLNLKMCYPKLQALLKTTRLNTIIVSTLQEALPFPKNILFALLKRGETVRIPRDSHHVRFRDPLHPPNVCEEEIEPPSIKPEEDIAVLQYTGGTTGTPKGAMLTHANLYANAIQCGMWVEGLSAGKESIMGVLPLFHVFAMTTVMNFGVHKAATLILHPRFEIKKLLRDIARKKPTLMPGVPTLFAAINAFPEIGRYDLSSLKACISGGAPLPGEVRETFEKLTGCSLVEGYGLTEASPVICANPLFGRKKAGSIGLPFPQTEVRIEDMERRGRFLEPGKKGELCAKGPQVMKGYWHKEEETKRVFDDAGWLRTGDVAVMDEEGYVCIVDRLKEVIISGGYNIYPRNVEEAIYMHEAVMEAAVVGVADAYRGQVVKAFVVKKEGRALTEAGLKDFLKDKLAPFELPKMVEFRKILPKTMIGKIDKKQLVQPEQTP